MNHLTVLGLHTLLRAAKSASSFLSQTEREITCWRQNGVLTCSEVPDLVLAMLMYLSNISSRILEDFSMELLPHILMGTDLELSTLDHTESRLLFLWDLLCLPGRTLIIFTWVYIYLSFFSFRKTSREVESSHNFISWGPSVYMKGVLKFATVRLLQCV